MRNESGYWTCAQRDKQAPFMPALGEMECGPRSWERPAMGEMECGPRTWERPAMGEMECGPRNWERKRREAVDSLFAMSKPTRIRVLLAVREMVKEAMVADPDMSEAERKALWGVVDFAWQDVMLSVDFQSRAALKGGRALADYEENASFGEAPANCSPASWRAKLLWHYLPFDKSINGRVKSRVYWILSLTAVVPFYCVRLVLFALLFVLHMTGSPPDTYQLMNFILSFKGAQFKGGLVLLAYAVGQYVMCVRPGDINSCATGGPGMNVPISDTLADSVGSCVVVWVAFMCLPFSVIHQGEHKDELHVHETEDEEDAAGKCCRSAGARRLLVLLVYDLAVGFVGTALFCWLAYLDVALVVTLEGPGAKPADLQRYQVYLGTEQARAAAFKARVLCALLAFPFVPFTLPGLSVIVTLTRWTGYNRQGYCVPFTLRPKSQHKKCRACDAPGQPPGH